MAKLTSAEVITQRLRDAYDPSFYESLYRLSNYAFGEPWDKTKSPPRASNGTFPFFPDITVQYQKVGQSRRIMSAMSIALSRVVYSQPSAEFPQLGAIDSLVRQRVLGKRAKHRGPGGEWGIEDDCVFLDGYGLGYGGCLVGLYSNPRSGLQRSGLQHMPAVHILRDWSERNPARSPWKCFVHVLSEERAEAVYGKKAVKQHGTVLGSESSSETPIRRVFRVFEYYDLGDERTAPTRAIIPGDITEEPLNREENPFSDYDGYPMIPFADYNNMLVPLQRNPVGAIAGQLPSQEARNEVEDYLRKIARKGPKDFIDTDQIEAESLKILSRNPNTEVPLKFNGKDANRPPMVRIPAAEAPQTMFAYGQMLDRESSAMDGTTEADRGAVTAERRTATELSLIDQRSQQMASRPAREWQTYQRRKMEILCAVIRDFDRDPLTIDADGAAVVLNDPEDPNLSLEGFFSKPSEIVVSEESANKQMMRSENLAKVQNLMQLAPIMDQLDQRRFAEELVKAVGLSPDDLLMDPNAMGVTGEGPMPQLG